VVTINLKLGKEKLIPLLLFTAAFAYLFSRICFDINIFDEGIVLYGAVSVLEGYIPYKDFWYIYSPGNLYFLALSFKIFGPSIILTRILNIITLFSVLICTNKITKDLVSDKISILISFILITLWLGLSQIFSVLSLPLLFTLLASISLITYFDRKQPYLLISSGIFTGLVSIFRIDFGLYTFLSITLTLIAYNHKFYSGLDFQPIKSLLKSLKSWGIYLGSFILSVLPVVIYFLAVVPISDLYSQLVTFPTQIYPVYRNLPYPTPFTIPIPSLHLVPILEFLNNLTSVLIFYFPFLIYFTTSVYVLFKLIKGKFGTKRDWIAILLLFLGIFFLSHSSVRPDPSYVHIFSTMIPAILLFSYICSEIFKVGDVLKSNIKFKKTSHILLKFFIIYVVLASFFTHTIHFQDDNTKIWSSMGLERGEGIYVTHQEDLIDAVKFIQQNVPLNEKIFVGNTHHDKIFINSAMFYFLAQRNSGTRYVDFEPGVVTTRIVQQEMIGELQKNNVRYIVLWNGDYFYESNKSNQSSEITDLDDFIKTNFVPIKTYGNYSIYKKKIS
jgi:hypothetical protein